MKRMFFFRTAVVGIVLAVILGMLVSCNLFGNNGEATDAGEKSTVTLVIDGTPETVYTVDLTKIEKTNGVMSLLEYLKQNEGLEYSSQDSGYGSYLTGVGNLHEDAASGTYIYIWTSVEKDMDVSAYAIEKQYGEKRLVSSGVGASQMSLENGCIIYIGTIKY